MGAGTVGAMAAPAANEPDADASTDAIRANSGRSGFTAALTGVAVIGGAAKSVFLDRARALAAYPHARAEGKTAMWTAQFISGRLTHDVVPITGGRISIAGKVVTSNGFLRSYQASNAISLALLGVGMTYGIPNLVEGWQDGGGPGGLVESRHGRTGVLGSLATIFQAGVMATAAAGVPAGTNRITGMLKSPIIASGPVILAGIALSIPVAINELGFLDHLDAGNDLSFVENARATISGHVDTVRGWLNLD